MWGIWYTTVLGNPLPQPSAIIRPFDGHRRRTVRSRLVQTNPSKGIPQPEVGSIAARPSTMLALCIEKIAVRFDMAGEPQRVLARQPLGELGVAPLQRLDQAHMV